MCSFSLPLKGPAAILKLHFPFGYSQAKLFVTELALRPSLISVFCETMAYAVALGGDAQRSSSVQCPAAGVQGMEQSNLVIVLRF